MSGEYRPYYLKLKPKEAIEYIGSEAFHLENSKLPFGFFRRHILSSGKQDWIVLRFDPYSKEQHPSFEIKSEEALNQAIKYLDEKGFKATSFDLEGLIDKID